MTTHATPPRHYSLRRLIALTQQHTPQNTTGLITHSHAPSANDAAKATSWDLLVAGLSHLVDGGINGAGGTLTTAVSRASLRSTPLASALGIPSPTFALVSDLMPCHEEHAGDVFVARRMTEAVIADIDVSTPLITRALTADAMIDRGTRDYFCRLPDIHRQSCELLLVMIDRLPPPASARNGHAPSP